MSAVQGSKRLILQMNFLNFLFPQWLPKEKHPHCLCKLFPCALQQTANKPANNFLCNGCNWAFLGPVNCCWKGLEGMIRDVLLRAGSRGYWLPWQLECGGNLVYQKASEPFLTLWDWVLMGSCSKDSFNIQRVPFPLLNQLTKFGMSHWEDVLIGSSTRGDYKQSIRNRQSSFWWEKVCQKFGSWITLW